MKNPKARHWSVACSANSELIGDRQVAGQPLFSKRDASGVWNKLS
ncbi:hypothetical protein [Duganella vulcania]|nr:hypothetical protein [Duganella vulcania]